MIQEKGKYTHISFYMVEGDPMVMCAVNVFKSIRGIPINYWKLNAKIQVFILIIIFNNAAMSSYL